MDTVDPLRFAFAFMFVIGLIGLMAMAMKYGKGVKKPFGPKWFRQSLFPAQDATGRIQVVETRYVDARRRLVLVRRDGVEHLLLLADGRELVIESGIKHEAAAT